MMMMYIIIIAVLTLSKSGSALYLDVCLSAQHRSECDLKGFQRQHQWQICSNSRHFNKKETEFNWIKIHVDEITNFQMKIIVYTAMTSVSFILYSVIWVYSYIYWIIFIWLTNFNTSAADSNCDSASITWFKSSEKKNCNLCLFVWASKCHWANLVFQN